jgi:hypothetical protein
MVEDPHAHHVTVLTEDSGKVALTDFYQMHFIPKMPSDLEIIPVSRRIGLD